MMLKIQNGCRCVSMFFLRAGWILRDFAGVPVLGHNMMYHEVRWDVPWKRTLRCELICWPHKPFSVGPIIEYQAGQAWNILKCWLPFRTTRVDSYLAGGWPILVNGKDYPIYEMENKSHVWNHQPVIFLVCLPGWLHKVFFVSQFFP
jgi:hypothetical protein